MVDKVPSILGKMAAIQKAVGAIPKNGVGPSQKGGFSYIKAEDILDKIHALLVDHDVIVVPRIQHTKHESQVVNNRVYINVTVEASYDYISVDDGSSLTVTAVGEGSDIGSDTATRKAATQALKVSHLHTFTIPNSEFDDEGYEPRVAQQAPEKVTPVKRALSNASKASGESTKLQAEVREFIKSGAYSSEQVNSVGERVAKELGKDSFVKSDEETLKALVAELRKGTVE